MKFNKDKWNYLEANLDEYATFLQQNADEAVEKVKCMRLVTYALEEALLEVLQHPQLENQSDRDRLEMLIGISIWSVRNIFYSLPDMEICEEIYKLLKKVLDGMYQNLEKDDE